MNISNIIHQTGILLTLGLPLAACQGADAPRDPFEMDDASTGSEDSDKLTTGGFPGEGGENGENGENGEDGDDSGDGDDSDDGAAASCGNGMVELGEDCDDNDSDDLDGCLSDCRFGPQGFEIDLDNPTELDLQGNLGGGTLHHDACPEGEVITGIQGSSGLWIDRVQVECGVLQLSHPDDPETLRLSVTPGTMLPARGGHGGSSFSARCPADHAVVGFGGRSGHSVDQLVLHCSRLNIVDDGISLSMGMDESFALQPVGSNGGGEFSDAQCEPGMVATVGNIRAGHYLDAFGLTCMPIELVF